MNTTQSESQIAANMEKQCKFVQDRIGVVENYFGDLCSLFGSYTRNLAKLRDKGDRIARIINSYTEFETLNDSTKAALKDFVQNFSTIQDYRNVEIERIESKVVHPLTLYGPNCKHTKEQVKYTCDALKKELKSKKQLAKTRQQNDPHQISRAQNEVQRTAAEAARVSHDLEQEMEKFEKKKLEDIKQTLTDFVNVELHFHAKSLEYYTLCYNNVAGLNEEKDVEKVISEFVTINLAFHSKAIEGYTRCYRSLEWVNQENDLQQFRQELRNSLRPMISGSYPAQMFPQQTSQSSQKNESANVSGGESTMASSQANQKTPRSRMGDTINSNVSASALSQSSMYTEDDDEEDDDDDDEEDDDEDDDDDDDDDEDKSIGAIYSQVRKPNQPQTKGTSGIQSKATPKRI